MSNLSKGGTDIEMVRKLYTAITSSDLYADYVSGAIDKLRFRLPAR